jgi:hypothetical protein
LTSLYATLSHHLNRLSFLLDTSSLPVTTRRQWVREELGFILAHLEQSEAPTRTAFLSYLRVLLPPSEVDRALAAGTAPLPCPPQ